MTLTSRFYLTVAVTITGASFQFYSFAALNTVQVPCPSSITALSECEGECRMCWRPGSKSATRPGAGG